MCWGIYVLHITTIFKENPELSVAGHSATYSMLWASYRLSYHCSIKTKILFLFHWMELQYVRMLSRKLQAQMFCQILNPIILPRKIGNIPITTEVCTCKTLYQSFMSLCTVLQTCNTVCDISVLSVLALSCLAYFSIPHCQSMSYVIWDVTECMKTVKM